MQQSISMFESTDINQPSLAETSSSKQKGNPGLRNLPAFHELMTRDGFFVPNLNSKFVNQVTLTQMYTSKIFRLR